jgi:Hydroxyethylthiazole kinase, sugar kinase family
MKNKADIQKQIVQTVNSVRKTTPLAGSITNTITINLVANAQLAVGGSAAMVYLPDEAVFLANAGGAFYINIGGIFPFTSKRCR